MNLDSLPARWVAEAVALSWSQDPGPFTSWALNTQLLTRLPTPTPPHSPRGEPEAHMLEAAYPVFNDNHRSWLKALEVQVSTE